MKNYTLTIEPDCYAEYPFKNMDFAGNWIFQTEEAIEQNFDTTSDNPMLSAVWNLDEATAQKLEDVINWKDSRTREWSSSQFESWKDALIGKYLSRVAVWQEFSLNGRNMHRGIAYISKESIVKEGWKSEEDAKRCLDSEITIVNQWIDGEVYAFMITNEDGDVIDSCGGFYGYEEAEREGESMLKYLESEQERSIAASNAETFNA